MKTITFKIEQILIMAVLSFIAFSVEVDANEPNNRAVTTTSSEIFIDAVEPELEVENWMIDEDYWVLSISEIYLESEASLELKNWMTDNDYWAAVSYTPKRDRFDARARGRSFAKGTR